MRRLVLHRSNRSIGLWSGASNISPRTSIIRRPVSFAEFEATPPGFVSITQFLEDNFSDCDRAALREIRIRRASEAIDAGEKLTPSKLRMKQGLSQAHLAERMGTSQPAIARLESGSERPSFDKLVKLQAALDVGYEELMEALSNVPIER